MQPADKKILPATGNSRPPSIQDTKHIAPNGHGDPKQLFDLLSALRNDFDLRWIDLACTRFR